MKRLAAIALILAAAAVPASAQRGASRGGFSGRAPSSAPAFHSSPSVSHFTGISRAPMPMARPNVRPSFYSASRYPGNRFPIDRPERNRYPISRPERDRYPIRRGFPSRSIVYGYPSGISYVPYPFLDSPFYDGELDDYGYNEGPPVPYAEAAPDPAAYGYTQPEDQPPPYESELQQPAEIVRPAPGPEITVRPETTARPEPEPAPATTLIFKDGRAPEQIRNYIATRSTVTVIDGPRHHDIPVADLDLLATSKANRDSGTGFQLPATSR